MQTPFFWTVTPPVFFLGKENGGRITRHLCRIDIRTCAKKEEFSFEKENIPLSRVPHTVWGIIECALRAQKKKHPFGCSLFIQQ